jgi:esterase/lipase superfamily enzyme
VAVLYSWPAATAGLFGYNPDRESSQFTISHLKHFIYITAKSEAVEKIHLISHSRGTDVLAEALRESRIHFAAQGLDPAKEMKVGECVFAAADIDVDVSSQRHGGERIGEAAEHLTIYTGAGDAALRISANMFKSRNRIGQITPDDLTERQKLTTRMFADQFTIVFNPRKTGFLGHAYFLDDPAVTSDLLLLLRDQRRPGVQNGRPLVEHDSGMWIIPEGYPFQDADTQ